MQSASSRIWTQITLFISDDNNHYTSGTSRMLQYKANVIYKDQFSRWASLNFRYIVREGVVNWNLNRALTRTHRSCQSSLLAFTPGETPILWEKWRAVCILLSAEALIFIRFWFAEYAIKIPITFKQLYSIHIINNQIPSPLVSLKIY